MSERHDLNVTLSPFGGTKSQPKQGTCVRVICSCGRSIETGDNYGAVPIDEIATRLKLSIHRGPWPRKATKR